MQPTEKMCNECRSNLKDERLIQAPSCGSPASRTRQSRTFCTVIIELSRGVAQPGSAPALGAGGRRFESSRPDQMRFFEMIVLRKIAPRLQKLVSLPSFPAALTAS